MIFDSSFFENNRKKLLDRLPDGVAVFFFSGEKKALSQDTDFRFLPDRNFYYLTGLSMPGVALILCKSQELRTAVLYCEEHNSHEERWHGKRMDFEEITRISGVADVRSSKLFEDEAYGYVHDSKINIANDSSSIMDAPRSFAAMVAQARSTEALIDVADIMTALRMVKTKSEQEAIAKADAITETALESIKSLIRPGVSELELYTALEYEMAKAGCLIPAFETIVACTSNSFYLHHAIPENTGDGIAYEGDTIQFDVGARFDGYCADISRVFYVGAEPSERFLKLHALIRLLRQTAFGFIKPGESFDTLNKRVRSVCGDWLLSEGLIAEKTDENISKYYWHNTGHHLGLDVHDTSFRKEEFRAGNTLAIEPGVYIPEWKIGFRIEDDVVVTESGCELLSSGRDSLEDSLCE